MPRPMTSTSPGTRRRSPTWETAMPPASSAPTTSRSVPSAIALRGERGDGDEQAAGDEEAR